MKWSLRIGRIAGIAVYMHGTFLILVGWVGVSHWLAQKSLVAALGGVIFILALFACVVLHELGHALAARRYGIATRDITLLPIGGLARLERIPEEPRQEIVVALAGPAVNVVLALGLWAWLAASGSLVPLGRLGVAAGPFLERLLVVNLMLVGFNLLPAFPMDGGRVLRALLALRLEYTRATQVAAGVGQALALLFGFLGLIANPFLLFIALFVWMGASQESAMAQMRSAFGGIPVARVMLTDFETLRPDDPLERAVELTLTGSQKDFPVVAAGRVVGILTQRDLLAGLKEQRGSVADSMQREFATLDPHEMLESGFARLQECRCRTVPVLHGGELAGLLTMDNLGEFVAIRSALSEPARRSRLERI